MKNHLMRLTDKLLAHKQAIVETIIDQLKNICQIEHSRHRRPTSFVVNVIRGLIAYCYQPKKLSLNLEFALPPLAEPELRLKLNIQGTAVGVVNVNIWIGQWRESNVQEST